MLYDSPLTEVGLFEKTIASTRGQAKDLENR
ncbi:hypothetical protein FHS27_003558 [Rhodopirellula rubra]|uniref:Uncharacterized protein n=1 Tax=Aporhodopirellula rubra TaxID=980271 RepID=A0A7W5E042_9BACT|nr:hypothetical protein [Aporhodopirellula rubra]